MDGHWDTPDLTQLLTVLAANQAALERAFYGRWWMRALLRVRHRLHANTRRQARRNIVAHYDLGNDFYARWLDPSMTYSSALFDGDFAKPLPVAQQAKYDRLLTALAIAPGRAYPRDRLRLGRLRGNRGARGPSRHRHLAVRCADRACARSARRRRARVRRARAGLSRRARDLRRHRLDRDVRSGGRALLAHVFPRGSRRARSRRTRVHPGDHDRRRRASSAIARSRISSSNTSFPAACWPRRRA